MCSAHTRTATCHFELLIVDNLSAVLLTYNFVHLFTNVYDGGAGI